MNMGLINKKISALEVIEEFYELTPISDHVIITIPLEEFDRDEKIVWFPTSRNDRYLETFLNELKDRNVIKDFKLDEGNLHKDGMETLFEFPRSARVIINLYPDSNKIFSDYKNKLLSCYTPYTGKGSRIVDVLPEPEKNNLTLSIGNAKLDFKFKNRGRIIEFFYNNRESGNWYKSDDVGAISSAQLGKMIHKINDKIKKHDKTEIIQVIKIKDKPDGSTKQNEYRWEIY